jgi:hypothetical protein
MHLTFQVPILIRYLRAAISKMSRELRYGLFAGIITVAWMASGYLLKWNQSDFGKYLPYVSFFILGITVYITVLHKRDLDSAGAITFKEAFIAGLSASFVIGVMAGLFLLFYSEYFHPAIVEEKIDEVKKYYETQSTATPQQVEQAIQGVKAMYSPFGQLTYGIGTTMLSGALVSLVCALIMRREKKLN